MLKRLMALFRKKPQVTPYTRKTPRYPYAHSRTTVEQRTIKPIEPIHHESPIVNVSAAQALSEMAGEIDATMMRISTMRTEDMNVGCHSVSVGDSSFSDSSSSTNSCD